MSEAVVLFLEASKTWLRKTGSSRSKFFRSFEARCCQIFQQTKVYALNQHAPKIIEILKAGENVASVLSVLASFDSTDSTHSSEVSYRFKVMGAWLFVLGYMEGGSRWSVALNGSGLEEL